MSINDNYDLLPEDFLPDVTELKKSVNSLKRELKKKDEWHEKEIVELRSQIRDLLTKNFELTEANNIFAKGLQVLKREEKIISEVHTWNMYGKQTLAVRIEQLTAHPTFGYDPKRRVVSVTPTKISSHGDVVEALIITEHIEKRK